MAEFAEDTPMLCEASSALFDKLAQGRLRLCRDLAAAMKNAGEEALDSGTPAAIIRLTDAHDREVNTTSIFVPRLGSVFSLPKGDQELFTNISTFLGVEWDLYIMKKSDRTMHLKLKPAVKRPAKNRNCSVM